MNVTYVRGGKTATARSRSTPRPLLTCPRSQADRRHRRRRRPRGGGAALAAVELSNSSHGGGDRVDRPARTGRGSAATASAGPPGRSRPRRRARPGRRRRPLRRRRLPASPGRGMLGRASSPRRLPRPLDASRSARQLASGQTLAQIAKTQGKTVDGLVAAMVAASKKALDTAVGNGYLTQQQEAFIEANLAARLKAFVNGTRARGRRYRYVASTGSAYCSVDGLPGRCARSGAGGALPALGEAVKVRASRPRASSCAEDRAFPPS